MTYRIHLTGIVQGVGFRPMVYAHAKEMCLLGTVSNSSAGVEIVFNADDKTSKIFYQFILQNLPPNSRVTHHYMQPINDCVFKEFSIIESSTSTDSIVLLSPDFALCESCRQEMNDPTNKRYRYGFITCTQCGPRYSITTHLPYDRIHTSMHDFNMCSDCGDEYLDPADRRFYSQTNACNQCGVKMSLDLPGQCITEEEEVIHHTIKLLRSGMTVAVKCIGGYLLLCDATHADAIIRLRERKYRPSKPFALLYPNESVLRADVELSKVELEALRSPAAPIVIVGMKKNAKSGIQHSWIAPWLNSLGVMLPYAPLLELIASHYNKPLIATSANISNAPIQYKNAEALQSLFAVADAVLVHNRYIVMPQDDSVVRFTDIGRRIIMRRSRGLAPTYFTSGTFPSQHVLAMGAHLKSSITLLNHANVYVSQYIGDLESIDTEQRYQTVVHHLLKITNTEPNIVLTDSHPDYASTRLGEQYAALHDIPIESIQHHYAHFAAILYEHDLQEVEKPVLGVIWDGIGLGADGHSWGGEFFSWNGDEMQRLSHLSYFPLILGDTMAREPRLSALAVTAEEHHSLLASRFTLQEWKVYSTVLKTEKNKTSSMGRLFDGVAAWCGLCDTASYEGEAALLLEEAATSFFVERKSYFNAYPIEYLNHEVNVLALMNSVIVDVQNGIASSEVAARFHCTLVNLIRLVAQMEHTQSIAFSGGVFQNALLVSLIEKHLAFEFKLYFHQQLSPNDECISLGQLAYWSMFHKREFRIKRNNNMMRVEHEQLF